MNAVASLVQSTIGKKAVMAVTGAMMVGWVTAHMLGNSFVFAGQEWLDWYGEHLQAMGPGLWLMRGVMLAVIGLHIWSAVSLTRLSVGARGGSYAGGRKNHRTTLAARTMRVGGLFIVGFLVWHLLDLTIGAVHPDFQKGHVFHNLTTSLSNPIVGTVYAVAAIFVGMHVSHGIQSALQTLGWTHPKYLQLRKVGSLGFGLLIAGGNLAIVLSILTGLVGA